MTNSRQDQPASFLDLGAQAQGFAVVFAALLEALEESDPGVAAAFNARLRRTLAELTDLSEADWSSGRVGRLLELVLRYTDT